MELVSNCDECDGRCCKAPMHRYALPADVAREPLIAVRVKKHKREEKWDLRGTRTEHICPFLLPDGKCEIHETKPDMCRRFVPGGYRCIGIQEGKILA